MRSAILPIINLSPCIEPDKSIIKTTALRPVGAAVTALAVPELVVTVSMASIRDAPTAR